MNSKSKLYSFKLLAIMCFMIAVLSMGFFFSFKKNIAVAEEGVESSTFVAAESFASGDGSQINPYSIGTPNQLAKLASDVVGGTNYSGKYFKLTDNIDLSGKIWTPIGSGERYFAGTFDGDGYTISNMYTDTSIMVNDHALFGSVLSGAVIKNLKVVDANVVGVTGYSNGILIGRCGGTGDVTVESCYVQGSVYGTADGIGGLIGSIESAVNLKMSRCYVNLTTSKPGGNDLFPLVGDKNSTIGKDGSINYYYAVCGNTVLTDYEDTKNATMEISVAGQTRAVNVWESEGVIYGVGNAAVYAVNQRGYLNDSNVTSSYGYISNYTKSSSNGGVYTKSIGSATLTPKTSNHVWAQYQINNINSGTAGTLVSNLDEYTSSKKTLSVSDITGASSWISGRQGYFAIFAGFDYKFLNFTVNSFDRSPSGMYSSNPEAHAGKLVYKIDGGENEEKLIIGTGQVGVAGRGVASVLSGVATLRMRYNDSIIQIETEPKDNYYLAQASIGVDGTNVVNLGINSYQSQRTINLYFTDAVKLYLNKTQNPSEGTFASANHYWFSPNGRTIYSSASDDLTSQISYTEVNFNSQITGLTHYVFRGWASEDIHADGTYYYPVAGELKYGGDSPAFSDDQRVWFGCNDAGQCALVQQKSISDFETPKLGDNRQLKEKTLYTIFEVASQKMQIVVKDFETNQNLREVISQVIGRDIGEIISVSVSGSCEFDRTTLTIIAPYNMSFDLTISYAEEPYEGVFYYSFSKDKIDDTLQGINTGNRGILQKVIVSGNNFNIWLKRSELEIGIQNKSSTGHNIEEDVFKGIGYEVTRLFGDFSEGNERFVGSLQYKKKIRYYDALQIAVTTEPKEGYRIANCFGDGAFNVIFDSPMMVQNIQSSGTVSVEVARNSCAVSINYKDFTDGNEKDFSRFGDLKGDYVIEVISAWKGERKTYQSGINITLYTGDTLILSVTSGEAYYLKEISASGALSALSESGLLQEDNLPGVTHKNEIANALTLTTDRDVLSITLRMSLREYTISYSVVKNEEEPESYVLPGEYYTIKADVDGSSVEFVDGKIMAMYGVNVSIGCEIVNDDAVQFEWWMNNSIQIPEHSLLFSGVNANHNLEIYIHLKKHDLVFNADPELGEKIVGEAGQSKTVSVYYGTEFKDFPTATRRGYKNTIAWISTGDSMTYSSEKPYQVTGKQYFKPSWEGLEEEYTVNYYPYVGGNLMGTDKVKTNQKFTPKTYTFTDKLIVGWAYKYNGEDCAFNVNSEGLFDTISYNFGQDLELYAIIEDKTYDIQVIVAKANLGKTRAPEFKVVKNGNLYTNIVYGNLNLGSIQNFLVDGKPAGENSVPDEGYSFVGYALKLLPNFEEQINGVTEEFLVCDDIADINGLTRTIKLYVVYKNYYKLAYPNSDDEINLKHGKLVVTVGSKVGTSINSGDNVTYGEQLFIKAEPNAGYNFLTSSVVVVSAPDGFEAKVDVTIGSENRGYAIVNMPKGDVELDMKFRAKTVALTYDLQGGMVGGKTGTVKGYVIFGENLYLFNYSSYKSITAENIGEVSEAYWLSNYELPSLSGYNFLGWSKSVGGEVFISVAETGYAGLPVWDEDTLSAALYAVWEPKTYNVKFEVPTDKIVSPETTISSILIATDEGNIIRNGSNNTFSVKAGERIILPMVRSASHYLSAWTYEELSLNPDDEYVWNIASDVTFVALWEEKNFIVNVSVYGENINDSNTGYEYSLLKANSQIFRNVKYGTGFFNGVIDLDNQSKPNEEGYTFIGYSVGVPGENVISKALSLRFDFSAQNEQVFEIAVIYKNHYTLKLSSENQDMGTISANGYKVADGLEITYNTAVQLIIEPKSGYVLKTLERTPSSLNIASDYTFTMKEDTAIVAIFEGKLINITFKDEGQTLFVGQVRFGTTDYRYGAEMGLPVPTKTGFTFVCWKDAESKTYTSSTIWDKTEDCSLYAEWGRSKNFVTINVYGEKVSSKNSEILENYELLNAGNVYVNSNAVSGSIQFEYNAQIIITFEPKEGFTLYGFKFSDGDLTTANQFSFNMSDFDRVINIYAKRNDYTLVLNANTEDAVAGLTQRTFTLNYEESFTLPVISRTGYGFEGWALSEAGEVVYAEGGTFVQDNQNVTLYAIWGAMKFDIDVIIKVENANGLYTAPIADGVTGWNVNGIESFPHKFSFGETLNIELELKDGFSVGKVLLNGDKVNINAVAVPNNGGTLEIYIDRTEYELKLSYNNADMPNKVVDEWVFNNGYAIRLIKQGANVLLPTLNLNGYDFIGWNENSSATKSDAGTIGGTYVQTIGGKTLYAVWEAHSFQISYNKNIINPCGDGKDVVNCSNLINPQVVKYGETYTFPVLTSDSHTFLGWDITVGEQTLKHGADDEKTIVWNYLFDAEFKAIWQIKKFTVNIEIWKENLDANRTGGVMSIVKSLGSQITAYGDTPSGIFEDVWKQEGYTFVGYFNASPSGQNPLTELPKAENNFTLYLLYKNYYKLTLETDGNGEVSAIVGGKTYGGDALVTYSENVTLVPSPTAATDGYGYVFDKFNCESVNIALTGTNFDMTDEDVLITALFKPKTVNLIYNANGGKFKTSAAVTRKGTVTFGKSDYSMTETPTLAGHTFIGWNTNSDGSGNGYNNLANWGETDNETTLYAIWEINSLTTQITFESDSLIGDGFEKNNAAGNFEITVNSSTRTLSEYQASLVFGTELSFRIVSISGGYAFSEVLFNGKPISADNGLYKVSIPVEGANVQIRVLRNKYNLTLSAGTSDEVKNEQNFVFTKTSGGNYEYVGTYKYGAQVVLPTITRTGYTLTGWIGSVEVKNGTVVISDNISLVATWKINTHTIMVTLTGAELDAVSFSIKNGSSVILESDGVNDILISDEVNFGETLSLNINSGSYVIKSVTSNLIGLSASPSQTFIVPDGELEIEITFMTSSDYSITLNAAYANGWENGGGDTNVWTISEDNSFATKSLTSGETISLIQPTREGYNFVGWSTTNGGSADYASNSYTVSENAFNLYAVWEKKNFDVSIKVQVENVSDESFAEVSDKSFDILIDGTSRTIVGALNEALAFETKLVINSINLEDGFAVCQIKVGENMLTTTLPYEIIITGDTEIILLVQRNTYEVKFELGDASAKLDENQKVLVKLGETIELLPATKNGYNFLGWSESVNSSTYVASHTQDSVQTKTYYANWEIAEFEIAIEKYVKDGNAYTLTTAGNIVISENAQLVADGKYKAQFDERIELRFDAGNYKFVNIFVDTVEYTENNIWFDMPGKNVTIKIYIEYQHFDLTLDASNGKEKVTFSGADWVVSGAVAKISLKSNESIALLTPTSNGYKFLGWGVSKLGTDIAYTAGATFIQTNEENTTLYARWQIESFNVSVKVQLENAENDDFVEVGFDTEAIISHNFSSETLDYKTVKQFDFALAGGYNLKEVISAIGKIIDNGSGNYSFRFIVPAEDAEIIIKIARNTYVLTYSMGTSDVQSVTVFPSPVTLKFGQKTTLADASSVSRTGYDFEGWFTENLGGGTKMSGEFTQGLQELTLYASWVQLPSEIIVKTYFNGTLEAKDGYFVLNEGNLQFVKNGNVFTISTKYGNEINLLINAKSYELASVNVSGLSIEGSGENRRIVVSSTSGIIEIYFTSVDFTVTVDAENNFGGDVQFSNIAGWNLSGNRASANISSGQEIALPAVTSNGYKFEGWYTGKNGTGEALRATEGIYVHLQDVKENVIYYAKWSVANFNLSSKVLTENADTGIFEENADGLTSITLQKQTNGVWQNVQEGDFEFGSAMRYVLVLKDGFYLDNTFVLNEGQYIYEFSCPANDLVTEIKIYRKTFSLKFVNSNDKALATMPTDKVLRFEQTITLDDISAVGYTFIGWNMALDGSSTIITTFTQGLSETTVYAIWNINSYNLTIRIEGVNKDETSFVAKNARGEQIEFTADASGLAFTSNGQIEYGSGITLVVNPGNYVIHSVSGGNEIGENIYLVTMADEDMEVVIKIGMQRYKFSLDASISGETDYVVGWTDLVGWTQENNTVWTEVEFGDSVLSLPTPSVDGFTFLGWIDEDGTVVTVYTQTENREIILRASWIGKDYNFNLSVKTESVVSGQFEDNLDGVENISLSIYNNGTWLLVTDFTQGENYAVAYKTSVKLVIALKPGFKLESLSGNAVVISSEGVEYEFKMPKEDFALEALVERETYTLKFDKNTTDNLKDEQNIPAIVEVKFGATIIIPEAILERKGYTFAGTWRVENAENFAANSSFTVSKAEDVTFYAVWTANSYQIEVDLDGGTGDNSTFNVGYDEAILLPHAEKTGYTLSGWKLDYTEGECEITDDSTLRNLENEHNATIVGYLSTKTLKLMPIWKANANEFAINSRLDTNLYSEKGLSIYNIPDAPTFSYTLDGNGVSSLTEVETGSEIVINAILPTGYKVKTWIVVGSEDTSVDNMLTIRNFTSNLAVTLMYEPIEVTVTISAGANGNATFVASDAGVYDISGLTAKTLVGAKVSLTTSANAGYVFKDATPSSGVANTNKTDVSVTDFTESFEIAVTFEERTNEIVVTGEHMQGVTYSINGGVVSTYSGKILAKTGDVVMVMVIPEFGYSVINMTSSAGDIVFADGAGKLTNFTGDLTVTVVTAINEYSLTLGVVGNAGGTADILTSSENGRFNHGQNVSVQATSETDLSTGFAKYNFIGWFEDYEGTRFVSEINPYSFNITSDMALFAKFEVKEFKVAFSIAAESTNLGTLKGVTYQLVSFGGSSTAVTAVPDVGYAFDKWVITRGNGVSESTNSSLEFTDVKEVITAEAYFKKLDITISVSTSLEGSALGLDVSKFAIKYVSGAERGDTASELLDMTLTAKSNTNIVLQAIAKEGYNFGVELAYEKYGNVSVEVNGNLITINAKENGTRVVINFARRMNVVTTKLKLDNETSLGLIRYKGDSGEWVHNDATAICNVRTEESLTLKVLIKEGYKLSSEFSAYVNAGEISKDGFKFAIMDTSDYSGLSANYFSEVYDVIISGFVSDVNFDILVERMSTRFTFHGGNVNDPSETFTADIFFNTRKLTNISDRTKLTPTDDRKEFLGWALDSNQGRKIINAYGDVIENWVDSAATADLYAVWQEKLLEIKVEVRPMDALQNPNALYDNLFANAFTHVEPVKKETLAGRYVYYTYPSSKLYLTLPMYKAGYVFNGFYLLDPATNKYNKLADNVGADSYATASNALISIQGYSFYTYSDEDKNGTISIMLGFDVTTSIRAVNKYDANRVSSIGGSVKFDGAVGTEGYNGWLNNISSSGANITLVATVDAGYTFLGWRDFATNEIVSTLARFTVAVNSMVRYEAIFMGNRVSVSSEETNVNFSGGNLEEFNGKQYYHVGDIINIRFAGTKVGYRHTGWDVFADGVKIEGLSRLYPSYTLTDKQMFVFNPTFIDKNVTVNVIMSGDGAGNGSLTFDDNWKYGNTKNENRYTFVIPYKTNISSKIIPNIRYSVKEVTYRINSGAMNTLEVNNGNFVLNYANFENADSITINVTFKELYWREYVLEENLIKYTSDNTYSAHDYFLGLGTEDNPYEINSIDDISVLAFVINNNIKQGNKQKMEYDTAFYELNAKIDFSSRFWTPIGTKEHPFKGTFYLRGERLGIFVNEDDEAYPARIMFAVDETYYTLYGKLFGYLDGAKIVVEGMPLLVLYVILGVIGGIGIVWLVTWLIARKRKKDLLTEKETEIK